MKVDIPETRGAKLKYDLTGMDKGETRSFGNTTPGTLINCAKSFSRKRGLRWKFRCYSMDGLTHIVRVE